MLVQIVLFTGFDPLDVVASFEVLSVGGNVSGGKIAVELVALEGAGKVTGGVGGLVLESTGSIDLERADMILVPGPAADDVSDVPALMMAAVGAGTSIFAEAMERPDVTVTTICGGSMILAVAGVLKGRNAVSHHLGLDFLETNGVNVVRARVVDDGDLITAGGVTSGLDLGLYVLERELGPKIALEIEKRFEYERRGTVWRSQGQLAEVAA